MALISNSEKETQLLGKRLASFLKPGDIIALRGDLGSGKTTFTKGIAVGLGVKNSQYVSSPSFVIVREHAAICRLYHIDLYRLDNIEDIEYIGIQEYLDSDGVTVIEWAEKLGPLTKREYISITIKTLSPKKRRLNIKPYGKRYSNIIGRYIKQQV
jgi:tRNA threonylcarbamoyladenosine biosynthesis protein TsaE